FTEVTYECSDTDNKTRLFLRNGRASTAWIGSANFTRAGFGRNEEVVYETGDCDEAMKWFERQWKKHEGPSAAEKIDEYRRRRKRQGVSITAAEMAGQPEHGMISRVQLLMNAGSWNEYSAALKQCDRLWAAEGVTWTVLGNKCSYVHTINEGNRIARHESWVGLNDRKRTILLGLRDGFEGTWGLLGSLKGAGEVQAVFRRSNEARRQEILTRIRNAVGRVIEASPDEFPDIAVDALEEICRETRFDYGVSTRLLTLARPDKLISINSRSQENLAETFGLAPTTLGKNYGQLLKNLYKTRWYRDRPGRSRKEQELWNMRAALVDSFVYDPRRIRRGRSMLSSK
ncbi:MAG: hypothetical protein OXH14_04670, partial [Alphaproteobacteria bacterium]|nr:hypothetical protein [Alphaproteobacteria bacterium]